MATKHVLYVVDFGGNAVTKSKELAGNLGAVDTASKKVDNSTQNLRKTFAGFGGQLGATGSKAINLVEGLGGIASGLGVAAAAAGGAALAIGGLVVAFIAASKAANAMVTAAVAAEKRIHDLGIASIAEEEAIASLAEAQKDAANSWDLLKVKFAAVLAPALKGILSGWEQITGAIGDAIIKQEEFGGSAFLDAPLVGGATNTGLDLTGLAGKPGFSKADIKELAGDAGKPATTPTPATRRAPLDLYNPNSSFWTQKGLKVNLSGIDTSAAALLARAAAANQPSHVGATNADVFAGVGGIASGNIGGVLGGALQGAIGGPIGAIAGAVMSLGPQLGSFIEGVGDQLFSFVTQLPANIMNALTSLTKVIDMVPSIVTGIVTAAPQIVAHLIKALPGLLIGLTEALITIPFVLARELLRLPELFFHAVKDAIAGIPAAIAEAIANVLGFLKDDQGKVLGTSFKKGEFEIFGFGQRKAEGKGKWADVPSMQGGGMVHKTGLILAHAGETVQPAHVSHNQQSLVVNIGTVQTSDPQRFVEWLRKLQGSYGRGLLLDPLAG